MNGTIIDEPIVVAASTPLIQLVCTTIGLVIASLALVAHSVGFLTGYYHISKLHFMVQMGIISSGVMEGIAGIVAFSSTTDIVCRIGMLTAVLAYAGLNSFLYIFFALRARIVEFGRPEFLHRVEYILLALVFVYPFIGAPWAITVVAGEVVEVEGQDTTACLISLTPGLSMFAFSFDSVTRREFSRLHLWNY